MESLRELTGEQVRRVSNPEVQGLLSGWFNAKPENGLPLSRAILPDLRAGRADRFIELIPNSDGEYLYVHYGAAVARYAGVDMTGKTTAAHRSEIGQYFRQKYDEAIALQEPLYTVHRADHANPVYTWERLILPLADPEKGVRLLVYSQPVQYRHELLDTILGATAYGILALEVEKIDGGRGQRFVVVLANDAMCGFAGISTPSLLFGRALETCLRDGAERALPSLCREALLSGEPKSIECANPFIEDGRSVAIAITPMTGGVSITVRDVTARMAQQEAGERARLDAEEANRSKSDFLARMSHEIRTPLNAIIGFAAILEMHGAVPPKKSIAREVGYIKAAADHLLGLIEDVVEISKLDVGAERLRIEPTDLSKVVADVLGFADGVPGAERLTMDVPDPGQPLGWVMADALRLRQVLMNLLSNAVKYNREGGQVALTVELLEKGMTRVVVSDTGAGIPPEKLSRVFVPFDRLGQENGRIDGTGLGLALSKRLIDGMGGRIDLSSSLGHGSRFWIEIPTAGDMVAPVGRPHEPVTTMSSRDGSQPIKAQHQKVVLYIEDNPANMMLMREVTQMASGIRLLEAKTAETGLAILEVQHPDIIFVDINLPGMDGFDVLERVRANPELAGIQTIAISASALPADVEKGLAAGFDNYITKPVDVQELLKILID